MSSVSSKRHLACFLSFIFMVAAVYAQNEVPAQETKGSDETAIFLDGSTAGDTEPADTGKDGKATTTSSAWILVRIVVMLALVCAGIYGVVYLLKKSTGGTAGNDPYLKNVASLYFSPNKSIQVVSLGDRAYMVGVTDQAINLLAEVSDRELVDAMNLSSDKKNPIPKGTFQNLLANFFPGAKGTAGPRANDGLSGAEAARNQSFAGSDFLRSQRERLQNAARDENSADRATDRGEA